MTHISECSDLVIFLVVLLIVITVGAGVTDHALLSLIHAKSNATVDKVHPLTTDYLAFPRASSLLLTFSPTILITHTSFSLASLLTR